MPADDGPDVAAEPLVVEAVCDIDVDAIVAWRRATRGPSLSEVFAAYSAGIRAAAARIRSNWVPPHSS